MVRQIRCSSKGFVIISQISSLKTVGGGGPIVANNPTKSPFPKYITLQSCSHVSYLPNTGVCPRRYYRKSHLVFILFVYDK